MSSELAPGPGSSDDGGQQQTAPAFAFAEGVLRQTVDGEMVLLDMGRQLYFGLDAVGADVVARLVTSSWRDALAAVVCDYDVDPAVLESDVRALVSDLQAAGLLRAVSDG